jgi:hypothetical protein
MKDCPHFEKAGRYDLPPFPDMKLSRWSFTSEEFTYHTAVFRYTSIVIVDPLRVAVYIVRFVVAGPPMTIPFSSNLELQQGHVITPFNGNGNWHPSKVHCEESATTVVKDALRTIIGQVELFGSGIFIEAPTVVSPEYFGSVRSSVTVFPIVCFTVLGALLLHESINVEVATAAKANFPRQRANSLRFSILLNILFLSVLNMRIPYLPNSAERLQGIH